MTQANHGRFDPNNPPEIVTRFLSFCEQFRERSIKSKEGIGNHDLYFTSQYSLEVWGSEDEPSYKVKGMGQVHRGLAGYLWEIDPDLLTVAENYLNKPTLR